MTAPPIPRRVGVFAGLSGAFILCLGFASGAEPLMDTGLFGVSRSVAVNQVKEGKFQEALAAEEKALKIARDRYGPLHPLLVPILNDMASLHRYLAEYGEADAELKWGLALRENNLGPGDLSVADSQDQLAALYNDLGRFQESEIMEKRALSIRQGNSAADPSALAFTLGLLGRIEINLHKNGQAQSLLEKALVEQDKNPHADAGFSIQLLTGLAECSRLDGLFSKAESSLQRALASARKNFPPDDTQVADAMENLADFYHSRNQDDKAKPLYESALKIDKPFVGTYAQYPAVPFMKRLAKAYQGTGNLPAAEGLWQSALKTEKGIFGPHHPQVAIDLMELAEVEMALGKNTLAQGDLKQSITILNSLFAEGHPLLEQAGFLLGKASKNN
jgi:tetratricopeptide (TPR) repeat protein